MKRPGLRFDVRVRSPILLVMGVCILLGCCAIIYAVLTGTVPYSSSLGLGLIAAAAIGAMLLVAGAMRWKTPE